MESQAVRRRINTVAAHLAVPFKENFSHSAPTHLFPMNCSGSLSSVIGRYDNRMYFARQASDSQACFMKQASLEQPQKCSNSLVSGIGRCDNKLYFARQASEFQGHFMRQASTEQRGLSHLSAPPKCINYPYEGSHNAFNSPLYSRASTTFSNVGEITSKAPECKSIVAAPESPTFARQSRKINEPKQSAPDHPQFARLNDGLNHPSFNNISASKSNEFKWSPSMDIAESRGKYLITVELPGISVSNIRVVVQEQKLTVMGNRSTQWWKMEGSPENSVAIFHQNEIQQGAFQIVWPLPNNVNIDCVSAEFMDGILQIKIPKFDKEDH